MPSPGKMDFRLIFLTLFFCGSYTVIQGQDTAGRYRINSPEALADSVIMCLEKAKKPEVLKPFFPPMGVFILAADSVKAGQNQQMLVARYQASWSRLRRDFKRFKKLMQEQRLSFRSATRDTSYLRITEPDAKPFYAYVYQEYTRKKKRFLVRFVAVRLTGYWYLFSDLQLREPD
ncbi:MAG: hypothetical protein RL160_1635 [Bacteroidota bacterium]